MIKPKFALTFDLEPDYGGRLETYAGIQVGLPKILDLLKSYNISATFFITGETMKKFPKTVLALAKYHEIGLHGFKHTAIQTKQDISVARGIYSSLGLKIECFRNPYLMPRSDLVTDLIDHGFKYDSSLVRSAFPMRYNHLSIPNRPYYPQESNIHKESKTQRELLEIPISTIPNTIIPFGMTYIRNKGFMIYQQFIKRCKHNLVFYGHGHDFIEPSKELPFYVKSDSHLSEIRLNELLSTRGFEFCLLSELGK